MNTFMALDLGAHAIKGRSTEKRILLPSTVSVDSDQRIADEMSQRNKKLPMQIETRDGKFFVGQRAHAYGVPVENLDFDRLTGTPEMRALLYGALAQMLPPDSPAWVEPIRLGVALPLKFLTGENGDRNKAKVKTFLRGKHSWNVNGRTYTAMLEPLVTSQPKASLSEYLLDDDGHDRQADTKATDEFGVLNFGRSTTEILVYRNRELVESLTFGEQYGVIDLLGLLDPQQLYTAAEMDDRLRDGAVELNGTLEIFASREFGLIDRRWKTTWRRFKRVVTGGGGAILLREQLQAKFQTKFYMPKDPVMSVADGLYRMLVQWMAASAAKAE